MISTELLVMHSNTWNHLTLTYPKLLEIEMIDLLIGRSNRMFTNNIFSIYVKLVFGIK